MNATFDRNVITGEGRAKRLPLAANTTIHAGTLLMLDINGNVIPAARGVRDNAVVVGYAGESAPIGAATVLVLSGVIQMENTDMGAPIQRSHTGLKCWAYDDSSVTSSSADDAPIAGIVFAVESDGVFVRVG
jgi:hypothetical protein